MSCALIFMIHYRLRVDKLVYHSRILIIFSERAHEFHTVTASRVMLDVLSANGQVMSNVLHNRSVAFRQSKASCFKNVQLLFQCYMTLK